MNLYEVAKKMVDLGYSVVAVDGKKLPLGAWKPLQSRLPHDFELESFNDSRCKGIAVVTGPVSGNLEVIDIDCKYDTTGTLFQDFLAQFPEGVFDKLVIASTVNGGYHIIYKSRGVQGNQKLAQRPSTEQEMKANPGDKVKVLIETRGTGGYFLIAPSAGYKFIQGKMSDVPEITDLEREFLLELSRTFNTYIKEPQVPREVSKAAFESEISPFEDFNNKADVVAMLEAKGWTLASQKGHKFYMKRPGTENKCSAEYDLEKNWFTVFSTSTEFEPLKAYQPYAVRAILDGINDWGEMSRLLYSEGYGSRRQKKSDKTDIHKELVGIPSSDEPLDFLIDMKSARQELEDYLAGRIAMGLDTGYSKFDEHFRFKRGNLVIVSGFDNIGKTTLVLWMAMISAVRHKWKWLLYTAENSRLSVMRDLITFYCCKPLRETTEAERNEAEAFVSNHFMMIDSNEMMDYSSFKKRFSAVKNVFNFDAMLIDPYNALDDSSASNTHQFNYSVLTDIKIWGRKNDVSVWINMHSVTSAARTTDADGYVVAPSKYHTEGGVKAANKADEFLVLHRITNHQNPEMRYTTMVSVEKVKETITGGKPTAKGAENSIHFRFHDRGHRFDIAGAMPQHPFDNVIKSIDYEQVLNDLPF